MALFKIEKGLAANLTTNRPTTNEGYCYFTSDDGKFYIDIATGSDLTKRVCLNAYKADQWKNAININGMSINGTANRINYGTCGTATGTAAKTVSCVGYVLATGSEIAVKFTYANTATNTTLNVNSTGAKLIKYKGSNIPAGFIEAGGTYVFRYNGSNYDIVGNIVLVDSALSTSSTHAVQNKVVTEALNQKANKTNGIYYIEGNAEGTAGTWTGTCSDITEYYDGLIISYKIGIAGASTTTLNINELGAQQVYLNNNTSLTTHYPVGSTLVLTYTGGYWKIANYDSNTKVTQASTTANANYHLLLAYSTNIKTSTASTARKNASLYYNPSTGLLTAPTFVGALSGNASTATSAAAFTSAQTINLTGDVTGSAASVGGWTISTTLKSTGVAAGAYGLASKTSPAFGSSFNVPYITVDAQGRITSAATCTVQLPANPNTDSKVTNTASSTAKFYITGTTSSTTNTGGQVFNPAISISGNTIIATNFSGTLSGKATTADSATVAASLATSTAGSATKPVYFSAGKPVACTYTLSSNVPSNAVFTDTKYAAGTGLSLSGSTFNHSNTVAARTSYAQSTSSSPGYAGTFKVYEPKYDAQGHITGLQAETITMPSAQTIPTTLKNPNSLTIGNISYDGSAAKTVTAADLGITGAMIYKGSSSTEIKDGETQAPTIGGTSIATTTLQAGNVVLYSGKEFVWNGSAWELLGDEGSYKVKQTAVSSPSASGNTTSFIDTISQDANGKITATKKTVSTMKAATSSANGTAGLVPAPAAGKQGQFLRGDGTWTLPSNATTSAAGLMSAADKTKLDGIATGANNYTLPTASSSTLGGVKIGSNISISNGTISVANASGTVKGVTIVYPAASCTTFSSDEGTVTPLAVQKGAKLFSYERLADTAVTETAIPRFIKSAVTINNVKYSGLENTNITIQSVKNSANNNSANVLCIPAEGGKKMVYGYCTDQVDGTSFIGGVFDASATEFPYAAGLAIGGTSGNLLWKSKRVLTTDDSYTHPTSAGNKHIPSGGSSGQILRWSASGTAVWGADNNTTYTIATGDSNGQIKVTPSSGSAYNVSVKGLGSAAYTASTDYATASHTHNYAGSSSAGGAATSANKVNKDLIIKFNGGSTEGENKFTFNGSIEKTLNITPEMISAAKASHSHNYAGSSSQGGSATKVAVSNTTPTSATSYFLHYSTGNSGDQSVLANNDLYYYDTGTASYLAVGSSSNMGGLTLQKGNSYYANIVPGDLTANRTLTIPNVSGTIITSANLPNYAGSSSVGGAATSANKVNSSLTIKLNGGSTEGTNLFTFNGSAAKSVNITPSSIKAAALESGNTFVSTNKFNQQTTFNGTILLGSATYGTAVPSTFANNQLFFVEDDGSSVPSGGSTGDVLIKQSNGKAAWGQNIADGINASAATSRINVAGIAGTGVYYNSNVFIENNVLMGAAWNDYAEYRICNDDYKPGQVICENGDDTLSISKERMQPGAEIISDTFGMVIGETEKAKCPIAISGRVLAYTFEPREQFKAGDAVCAGPNGTVSKMTREEIREYPDRIIGIVSAIPNYKIWNEKVIVDNRIWIKVK